MKKPVVLILLTLVMTFSCEEKELLSSRATQVAPSESEISHDRLDVKSNDGVWIPTEIENCFSKVKTPEPIEIEDSFNPYYLRANMDESSKPNIVVLVRNVSEKKIRGVLICRNSSEVYLFGMVTKSPVHFSDMANDNFVTNQWEVLSHKETKAIKRDDNGKTIGDDAKGESVIFLFDGGVFIVYWDGKQFKGIGGV